ncbi:MAG: peptidoglycan-binding domain-containing protein, partial [Mariprofundaceae bacterium]|nr:peptidoglycan-binding domain-containing protein [Mariprofundaceae bacterium]
NHAPMPMHPSTHATNTRSAAPVNNTDLLPPNPKTGQCYARVLIPAVYKEEKKRRLQKEASFKLKAHHPTYKWEEKKVLVKGEYEVAKLIPAKYEWRTKKIMVKPAHTHLKVIAAKYDWKVEKILIKPAYSTWKKGRGPIEKINNSTGEIMCLIEVPAEYKTVKTKILTEAEHTIKEPHKGVYKTIKSKVMVAGPRIVKTKVPAVYKTVKVKLVDQVGVVDKIAIPAVYENVTERTKVSDGYLEWRTILCETNTNADVIRHLQTALRDSGHNPGPIDGVIGVKTMAAVKAYQRANNLPVGQLTLETLRGLKVI